MKSTKIKRTKMRSKQTENNNRKKYEWLLIATGLVILECIFFRRLIWDDKFPGGDTALIMMECDHWYDVFRYGHGLTEMRAFWPVNMWLGGSDMMLGEGLLHSLLRMAGCDMFTAYIVTVVITHFIGVFFLWLLLKNIGIKKIYIIAAEVISFFSCSFVSFSGHSQFFSFSYMAVLFWAIERIFHYRSDSEKDNRYKRYFYEFIAILFYGSSFLTAFYVGYFMTIWMGLTAVFLMIICRKRFLLRRSGGYIPSARFIFRCLIYRVADIRMKKWHFFPLIGAISSGPSRKLRWRDCGTVWSNIVFRQIWKCGGELLKLKYQADIRSSLFYCLFSL